MHWQHRVNKCLIQIPSGPAKLHSRNLMLMCLAIPTGWHSRNAARLGMASSLPMLQLHLMHQQCHDLEWGMVWLYDFMTLLRYCITTNIPNKLAWWCCFHIQLTTQTTKVHLLHGPAKPGSWERLGGLHLLHSLHASRLALDQLIFPSRSACSSRFYRCRVEVPS